MRRWFLWATLLCAPLTLAETATRFDYNASSRQLIQHGVQAVLMCNGLFTSQRPLERVFAEELSYLRAPVGSPEGGAYRIDRTLKLVEVGERGSGQVVRAVFRTGIGCVVMAPDQTLAEISALPEFLMPAPAGNPAELPWPMGDRLLSGDRTTGANQQALSAAADWAFERSTPEQRTLSLLVVHRGQIVLERYAPGVDKNTKTRTWSTAKSLAVTLIGQLVDAGKLSLDEPLGIDWLPEMNSAASDPRRYITLRHVLNMSSGLEPVDSFGREYVTGSGLSYWAGASSIEGARARGLVRDPGSHWDYENYDTLLAVYAMKRALGGGKAYAEFPRRSLLDPLGMRDTLLSTDRFGDFILSSQVYSNARDLARFGLLYLQNGVWQGERLLSQKWIDFVRTPAPSTRDRGNDYGGQFWLVPDERTDVPRSAYATAGNRGQYVVIVPSHDAVIVRRGLDYGRQGFNRWDLTREVLKALPAQSAAR